MRTARSTLFWLAVGGLGCGSCTRATRAVSGTADEHIAQRQEPRAPEANAGAATIDEVPDTDEGLPGAGPIRRADWFREVWRTRHRAWAPHAKRDEGAVVFLGDSITQGWGDDVGGSFPGLKVANRGISGDTSRGVLVRLDQDVLALHPAAVVLLIGTNDLEEQADPEAIAGNVRLILAALRTRDPGMPVVLCRVFPSSARMHRPKEKILRLNALYADLAKGDPHVTLIDTWTIFADPNGDANPSEFPDLLHPNAAGYEKWASALRPALQGIATH